MNTLNDIYKTYKYTGINYDDYCNILFKNEINYFNSDKMGIMEYKKAFKNELIKKMDKLVIENLFDDTKVNALLDNYVNQYFKENKERINYDKFSKFLDRYDFIPSADTIIYLIKNNDLFCSTANYIYKIQALNFDNKELFENNFQAQLIRVCNSLENISVINVEKEIDNFDYSDNIKIYMKEVCSIPMLSESEEKELAMRIAMGDMDARQKLIESNLRLVVNIANKFNGRNMPILDLIQEGNIGLMTAADRYNYKKGYRFSTYAYCYIVSSINKAIQNKSRNIKLPERFVGQIKKYSDVSDKLFNKLNRKPTNLEIAKEMNIKEKVIEEIEKHLVDTISLNTIINEKKKDLFIFVKSDEDLEEIVEQKNLCEQIKKLLDTCNLTVQEKEVLKLRYGLYDGNIYSQVSCAKILNLTRQRISQIESSALTKIRKNINIKDFKDYLDKPDISTKKLKKMKEKLNKK